MPTKEIHLCQCPVCQQEPEHPDKAEHRRINLLLSRLDEQQRRWFVAHESQRIGYGGDHLLAQITGLDEKTIAKGRQELDADLLARPTDQIRLPGGGRPTREKKTQT
jgi:hypothetical protein